MELLTLIVGGAFVLGTMVLAVILALLVQRYVPVDHRRPNNDVAGLVFAIVGVLYAVLLSIVTVGVWDASDRAKDNFQQEARSLVEVGRYGTLVGSDAEDRLLQLTRDYADLVVNEEWPRMEEGLPIAGDRGAELIDQMWVAVDSVSPDSHAGALRQAEARDSLRMLGLNRDSRISTADDGLPSVIWFALFAGAALTVGNALLFGVPGRGAYSTMVAMIAAMSVLLLFTIYQMEYPFQRGQPVSVESFTHVAAQLHR